ncbi:unnamed protein product [Linum trigynum]|uniref:Uncharacterized protein n=1 Tax=Linum trigynum TaxID=586398 RepID=A0AAV2GJY4_9ROSI
MFGTIMRYYLDQGPIPRPHKPWPPTPHRMSVDVPRLSSEATPPTNRRRYSTDERPSMAQRNLPPPPAMVTPVARHTRSKKTVQPQSAQGLP